MLCDAPALIHTLRLSQGRGLTVRPVCPRDAGLVQAFVRGLSPAARYSGCFGPLQDLSPDQTRTRHTSRPMALIAKADDGDTPLMIGEARYAIASDGENSGFAPSASDAWQGAARGCSLIWSAGQGAAVLSLLSATCCDSTRR